MEKTLKNKIPAFILLSIALAFTLSVFMVTAYAIFLVGVPYLYENQLSAFTYGDYTAIDFFLDFIEISSFLALALIHWKLFKFISKLISTPPATEPFGINDIRQLLNKHRLEQSLGKTK